MENCQHKGAHEVHTSLILQRQELNSERGVRPLPPEPAEQGKAGGVARDVPGVCLSTATLSGKCHH